MRTPENISLTDEGSALKIIDQTRLPNELRYLTLSSKEELYGAIHSLQVRGAPAIGIFAAYALYILAASTKATDYQSFLNDVREHEAYLNAARPTAVNLCKMTRRMREHVSSLEGSSIEDILASMKKQAQQIQEEDIGMCRAIAEYGLGLLQEIAGEESARAQVSGTAPTTQSGCSADDANAEAIGVLTYCNAGELATSLYGTALGPLFLAKEQGMRLHAWCSETRPLLQGARLTTFELSRAGIDCTLICDNMASIAMKEGKIQACLVGCDRVATNGDTANKIGTSAVAILAKHYGIPFYVLGPSSSIDFESASGEDIVIELREAEEIKSTYFKEPIAPAQVACYNPSFDVTDNSLITAIITERGICLPPFEESFKELFGEEMRAAGADVETACTHDDTACTHTSESTRGPVQ